MGQRVRIASRGAVVALRVSLRMSKSPHDRVWAVCSGRCRTVVVEVLVLLALLVVVVVVFVFVLTAEGAQLARGEPVVA